jgi:formamidase
VDIPNACTTIGVPRDIFDFDIGPEAGAQVLDMGSCAFQSGFTEGKVTEGEKNSEHSFGGGMTYKASVSDKVKEVVMGS